MKFLTILTARASHGKLAECTRQTQFTAVRRREAHAGGGMGSHGGLEYLDELIHQLSKTCQTKSVHGMNCEGEDCKSLWVGNL
jgi:hypothetical protein